MQSEIMLNFGFMHYGHHTHVRKRSLAEREADTETDQNPSTGENTNGKWPVFI